jgi:hypothetical protein
VLEYVPPSKCEAPNASQHNQKKSKKQNHTRKEKENEIATLV